MIKTNSFISVFLFLLFLQIIMINYASAETLNEISLPSSRRPLLNMSNACEVYTPSKLIIGKDNKFVVKGPPGSNVSLAISNAGKGASPLYGHELRLGETELTIEGVIPANGIVELIYKLPEDESLVSQTRFFEVAVWSKNDFSDLQIAKTMSTSGRESLNNSVVISNPPSSGKNPTFGAAVPGLPPGFIESVSTMDKIKEGKINSELIDTGEESTIDPNVIKQSNMLYNRGVIDNQK